MFTMPGPLDFIAVARTTLEFWEREQVFPRLVTTMTPELRRKAMARHLVHHIQMMRKEARLNVEDRIRISVDADREATEAIEEHSVYICAETLAVELRHGSPPPGWMARETDIEAARISVAVARA